jgi:hypothetical protein
MLYEINNKYYVNISPSIYVEVVITLINGEGVITPTQNRLEANSNTTINSITLKEIVEKIKTNTKATEDTEFNISKVLHTKRSKR